MLEALVRDFQLGGRRLRREPGFAVTVIVTLALGIGTSTAVFTVTNTILVRPLPFPTPERLVVLQSTSPTAEAPFTVAPGVFYDWRERAASFESMGGAELRGATVSINDGEPTMRPIARASAAFLTTLGVSPTAGRLFTLDEEQSASTDLVLVEEGLWRREFGGRLDIIGQRIGVDSVSPTIVGVVRSGFRFRGVSPDLWIPMPPRPTARTGGGVTVIARLKPAVAREQVEAELEVVHQQIGREHPEDSRLGVVVTPLRDWVVRNGRRGLCDGCLVIGKPSMGSSRCWSKRWSIRRAIRGAATARRIGWSWARPRGADATIARTSVMAPGRSASGSTR